MAYVDFLSRNPISNKCSYANNATEVRVIIAEITENWQIAEQKRNKEICGIVPQLKRRWDTGRYSENIRDEKWIIIS